jgi:hypothetical protein
VCVCVCVCVRVRACVRACVRVCAGTNTPLSNELCAVALTSEEVQLAEALLGRVARLAAAAAEKGVRLMIDAEHTYFQPVSQRVSSCAASTAATSPGA